RLPTPSLDLSQADPREMSLAIPEAAQAIHPLGGALARYIMAAHAAHFDPVIKTFIREVISSPDARFKGVAGMLNFVDAVERLERFKEETTSGLIRVTFGEIARAIHSDGNIDKMALE